METNKVICGDAVEKLREMPDKSVDLIFTDPPYNLSTEWIIRPDGRPDVKGKAKDFMSKWEGLDGTFLEQYYSECFRVLKYGGRIIFFGMDRQLFAFLYYANLAGFQQQQNLYWYSISGFPKSSDLSKMLDRTAGMEREIIGVDEKTAKRNPKGSLSAGYGVSGDDNNQIRKLNCDITAPTSDLAKKYDGYKYSIAPLKQVCEEIVVFQKPYKTGSALHDTLTYENGDPECLCGALDIDGNRVPTSEGVDEKHRLSAWSNHEKSLTMHGQKYKDMSDVIPLSGRYPAQTFIDSGAAAILDAQSGVKSSGAMKSTHKVGGKGKEGNLVNYGIYGERKAKPFPTETEASEGGCSKILMKCDYDDGDFDLYLYCPKVSRDERNAGCEDLPQKAGNSEFRPNDNGENGLQSRMHGATIKGSNNHPTVKPLALCLAVLKLFKTPNEQVVVDTFAGSGSLLIAAGKLEYQWIGIELNSENVTIAEARIKHHLGIFK